MDVFPGLPMWSKPLVLPYPLSLKHEQPREFRLSPVIQRDSLTELLFREALTRVQHHSFGIPGGPNAAGCHIGV